MRTSKKVPIDGAKLEREIAARKLTKVQASDKIGYSHSYLSNCGAEGLISPIAVKLLETVLGIMYEDIRPDAEEDSNLIELSKVREQREKIEFFESCEERIENAVSTMGVCLDLCKKMQGLKYQIEQDMQELKVIQEVYQKTLSRIKEAS